MSDILLYKASSRKTGKPVPLHNLIITLAVPSCENITLNCLHLNFQYCSQSLLLRMLICVLTGPEVIK